MENDDFFEEDELELGNDATSTFTGMLYRRFVDGVPSRFTTSLLSDICSLTEKQVTSLINESEVLPTYSIIANDMARRDNYSIRGPYVSVRCTNPRERGRREYIVKEVEFGKDPHAVHLAHDVHRSFQKHAAYELVFRRKRTHVQAAIKEHHGLGIHEAIRYGTGWEKIRVQCGCCNLHESNTIPTDFTAQLRFREYLEDVYGLKKDQFMLACTNINLRNIADRVQIRRLELLSLQH
mmetsp:Transcript_34879/g.58404  ORF Transcript_34879/g.58404 Transcript_34879/m.58404 type:complete len:237 (+) Transcript_34879:58-768(+)